MSAYEGPQFIPQNEPMPGSTVVPIAHDVTCRKCGYNLRGLSPDGRCPECGTAVGYSLQGDLLRFCDPNWVDILRGGASLFIWGIVTIFVGSIAGSFLQASTGSPVLAILAILAGWVLTTVGWWKMTEPDPSGLGEDRYGTPRKIIRIALIVSIFAQVIDHLPQLTKLDPASALAVQVVAVVLGLVGIVGFFAQLLYLKRLALRIPDAQLSGRAGFLMKALPISYGAMIVLGILAALMMRNSSPPSGGLGGLGCAAGIIGITVLVFGIMYLLLVEKMGKRFKEQAAIARRSWAATNFAGPVSAT